MCHRTLAAFHAISRRCSALSFAALAGPPSRRYLRALVGAYVRRVPWETAPRIARKHALGNPAACARFDLAFWADAVRLGTGGTCFESNYAFFALLSALGVEVYLTINDMDAQRGCHTAIVLNLAGERWLADVGIPLYVPIRLDPDRATSARSHLHAYRITPEGGGRYRVTRTNHPAPYIFTLIDQPVPDAAYRAALTADYSPDGLFLDRLIINKVIGDTAWRYCLDEAPDHLIAFCRGERTENAIAGDRAAAVAGWFGVDEEVVRAALAALDSPVTPRYTPARRDAAGQNRHRFWDESYERLDEYLQHLKEKERNRDHGKPGGCPDVHDAVGSGDRHDARRRRAAQARLRGLDQPRARAALDVRPG